MTDEAQKGFSGENWATVIGGAGQGAANVLGSMSQTVNSKKEAKENKRRTLSKLMNNALNRKLKLLKEKHKYANELNDIKQNDIQDVARGFVDSFSGSTKRTRR